MKIGVIADDLTGAMDTGVQFAKYGLKTVLRLDNRNIPSQEVEIINTDSRETSVDLARKRMFDAVSSLRGRLLFKKIDSTLRGHLDAEITTILNASSFQKAIICPAVIEQGRMVLEAQLWIDEQPLHKTAFAHDPTWPAHTSRIQDRFHGDIAGIPLSVVRSGKTNLRTRLQFSKEHILVPSVTSGTDLVHIAEAIISTNILPCGAFALARAWIAVLTNREPNNKKLRTSMRHPVLFVSGSHHPRTHEQLRVLINSQDIIEIVVTTNAPEFNNHVSKMPKLKELQNKSILIRSPIEDVLSNKEKSAIQNGLATITKSIIETYPINALVVCGGDTASSLLRVLSSETINIHGEIVPGFPFGTLQGGIGENLPILTKAGGFGTPEILTYSFN